MTTLCFHENDLSRRDTEYTQSKQMDWFDDAIIDACEQDVWDPTWISVSADGRKIVLASDKTNISIWSKLPGRDEWVRDELLEGVNGGRSKVELLPDGGIVLLAGKVLQILHKHPKSGEWQKETMPDISEPSISDFGCLPDGGIVTNWRDDNTVRIWQKNTTTGEWIVHQTFAGHSADVVGLSVTENGHILLIHSDKTVSFWTKDPKSEEWIGERTIGCHEKDVTKVVRTLDGAIVTGTDNGILHVWRKNTTNGKWEEEMRDRACWEPIYALASHPSGGFVCESDYRNVKFWQKDKTEHKWAIEVSLPNEEDRAESIVCVTCLPDGDVVLCDYGSEILRCRQISSFRPFLALFTLVSVRSMLTSRK